MRSIAAFQRQCVSRSDVPIGDSLGKVKIGSNTMDRNTQSIRNIEQFMFTIRSLNGADDMHLCRIAGPNSVAVQEVR